MASSIVHAGPGGRLRRILAVLSLGLPLIITTVPATATVQALPSEGWQFTGDDQAQEVRAVLKSGELNATIAFERDARRWSIALHYPDGGAPSGAVSLRAVYDADPSRNRPHRVEQLSLRPQLGESAAQRGDTLKLALPHTFILHLQGADRIEVEDDGRTVTIPLQGSAKAIAMIYAALGEAHGGGGKTMTELANDLGSASSDTASSHESTDDSEKASAAAKLEPTAPITQPQGRPSVPAWPGYNCELNDDIQVADFGTCLQDRIAEINDYLAKTGDRPYLDNYSVSEAIKLTDGHEIVSQVSRYIEQQYPGRPGWLCYEINVPHDMSSNKNAASDFLSDELRCLKRYLNIYWDDLNDKYYNVLEIIPIDYYGSDLKEKLDEVMNREESKYREFRKALEPRYQEHFRTRKAHGLM